MSRKHNVAKRGRRSKSRYKDRLARRGLRSADVAMEDADTLRARQERRVGNGDLAGIADEVAWNAPRPLTGRRP